MSYILEALKKSERERGHGNAPGVQTVHSSSLNYHAAKRSLWPWVLIAAVVLNVAVLLFFIFNKNTPAPVAEPAIVYTPTMKRPPRPVTETARPQAAPQPAYFAAPETNEFETARVTPTQSANASRAASFAAMDISQLPDNIRSQIPEMEFSAHVYSSNPIQRSVVINGRFMEEGESLNDDFVLKEITSTGVIMDFRGYLFQAGVITGW